MISKCVETNFKVIGNTRINVELLLLLTKLRTIINTKSKGTLTINVDNTDDSLSFNFTVNDNEFDPIKLNDKFNFL